MDIQLGAGEKQPLYLQLRDQLRARLLSGAIAPGSRLPSAREMSQLLHVSRNTVDEAYRMLQDEGLVRIVSGQGTFAAARRAEGNAPAEESGPGTGSGAALDWDACVARQARDFTDFREHQGRVDLGNRQVISFSSLAPDYHAFENDAFRRALNAVMIDEGSVLLAYGYTRGYEPFRQYIRQYLTGKGLRMEGQEVLITSGFRQGAGLVVETLVEPGSRVAVEAPTYNGFLGILRARGAQAVPVDCDAEGMIPQRLEEALDEGEVRLVYLIPTYHNPTGRNMSLRRRQSILNLCARRGIPILEDGFNEELRFRGECHPAIKALEGSGCVVYAGSFSKVLFPGIRVGWVVAPSALMRYLVNAKYNQDIHTPPLLQAALRRYCLDGSLDRHIKRTRGLYRERLDALYGALETHFSGRARWEKVEGGFSAWVEFPEEMDLRAAMEGARERGVLYAPGDAFYPDGRGRNCIRLGFSRLTPEKIEQGIGILSDYIASLGG